MRGGEHRTFIEGEGVHVETAHQVPMTAKAAPGADPVPALGFVTMAASRTPGARSPLRPGEARDAGLCAFMRQVIDVLAVFPLRHALIVFASGAALAHAVGIAHEEARNLMRLAELDDLPRSLVAQVADAPLDPRGQNVAAFAQALPSLRAFLAPRQQPGKLGVHLVLAPLFATDAAARDDEAVAVVGGNGALMDFAQIDRGVNGTLDTGGFGQFDAEMRLVMRPVPDDFAGRGRLEPIGFLEDERFPSASHGQDDAISLNRHGLFRPHQGIERFVAVRVTDVLVAVFALFPGRFDVAKEHAKYHLDGLRMQCKPSFGEEMQFERPRPFAPFGHAAMQLIAAGHPHLGRFLLPRPNTSGHVAGYSGQVDDADGLQCRGHRI